MSQKLPRVTADKMIKVIEKSLGLLCSQLEQCYFLPSTAKRSF